MGVDVTIRSDVDKRARFPITIIVSDEKGKVLHELQCEAFRLESDLMRLSLYKVRHEGVSCPGVINNVEYCDFVGWFAPATSSEEPQGGQA